MEITTTNVLPAFMLTLLAGLSTGLGGVISLFAVKRKDSHKTFLPFALGLSAGVMIYVSFMEILLEAQTTLVAARGETVGQGMTVLGFFLGIAVIFIIDRLLPDEVNPHEIHDETDTKATWQRDRDRLQRVGVMTAIGIVIHNFPEGLATFMSALEDVRLGVAIAIAIAIHNIPEGIAVAVPIYYASGSRKKALKASFLSGLAEPLGALIGGIVLLPFMSPTVYGVIMGAVAGIMVFISLDELLPTAEAYGKHHLAIFGVVLGMAIMALTLLLV